MTFPGRKWNAPDLPIMPKNCLSGAFSFPNVWRPSHHEGEELTRPFFTEDPRLLVEKGGFVEGIEAVMMGYNKHEALLYTGALVYKEPETFEFLKYVHKKFGDIKMELRTSIYTQAKLEQVHR